MENHLDPAALVRRARERSGMSQRALAERAGTSQSVIARTERGQSSPTVGTLNRLLEATGHVVETRLTPNPDLLRSRAEAYFYRDAPEGVVAAYLFGSTAVGRTHRESDVDIGVLLDRALCPSRRERSMLRMHLGAALVVALGKNDVDLVVLNDVPPGLATRIVLDGTLLMARDPGQVHAFTRDVQLRPGDLQPFLRRSARIKRRALGDGAP